MVSMLLSGIATSSAVDAESWWRVALQPADGVKPWANASQIAAACKREDLCQCKIFGDGCSGGKLTTAPTDRFPLHPPDHYCKIYGLCGADLPNHLREMFESLNIKATHNASAVPAAAPAAAGGESKHCVQESFTGMDDWYKEIPRQAEDADCSYLCFNDRKEWCATYEFSAEENGGTCNMFKNCSAKAASKHLTTDKAATEQPTTDKAAPEQLTEDDAPKQLTENHAAPDQLKQSKKLGLADINRMYHDGKPSDDVAKAGLFVHQHDNSDEWDKPLFDATWEQWPHMSGSVISRSTSGLYNTECGIMVVPQAAKVLCSYYADFTSWNVGCDTPDIRGLGKKLDGVSLSGHQMTKRPTRSRNKPYGPDQLEEMLEISLELQNGSSALPREEWGTRLDRTGNRSTWHGALEERLEKVPTSEAVPNFYDGYYNEVLINRSLYTARLPYSIAGIFFLSGQPWETDKGRICAETTLGSLRTQYGETAGHVEIYAHTPGHGFTDYNTYKAANSKNTMRAKSLLPLAQKASSQKGKLQTKLQRDVAPPVTNPLQVPAPVTAASGADDAKRCVAVESAVVDDTWCDTSCNHDPPMCPEAMCTCARGALPSPAPGAQFAPGATDEPNNKELRDKAASLYRLLASLKRAQVAEIDTPDLRKKARVADTATPHLRKTAQIAETATTDLRATAQDAYSDTSDLRENGCKDHQLECTSWAVEGQCESNPKFMTSSCAFSCTRCNEGPKFFNEMRSQEQRAKLLHMRDRSLYSTRNRDRDARPVDKV